MKTLNTLSIAAAVAGAVSLAAVTTATPAMAAKTKCYGISKAGQNDCGNAAGTHSCAGQSKVSYSGDDWKGVASKAACLKAGGSIKPFKGINPKKKSS